MATRQKSWLSQSVEFHFLGTHFFILSHSPSATRLQNLPAQHLALSLLCYMKAALYPSWHGRQYREARARAPHDRRILSRTA